MKNSRRGFSFIEVLLVLIIAGLLAAVFIPAATGKTIGRAKSKYFGA